MMIFPTVSGTTLDGRRITLPTGLEGEYNLLVIAFQQRQRLQVDMWMWQLRSRRCRRTSQFARL